MNRLLRLLLPSTLAVLLAALTLAATASAEVRTGEASSPTDPSLPGAADLLHANATYDSHTGSVVFEITAREAPVAKSKVVTLAGLATVNGPCDATVAKTPAYPTFVETGAWEEANSAWQAGWQAAEAEGPPAPGNLGLGSWGLQGTTVTLAASATPAIAKPYNCALVAIGAEGVPNEPTEFVIFPLAVPKPAEPVTVPAEPVVKTVTVTVPAPAPASAPAKLELAKSKALSAKADAWTKASVKVTNAGGTAVGPVTIKAKGPAGVKVRPGQMTVPALLPGQSWTVNFRVKVPADAKPRSTLALSATGGGVTAAGSLTVKSTD
jgi:hypothetical protein